MILFMFMLSHVFRATAWALAVDISIYSTSSTMEVSGNVEDPSKKLGGPCIYLGFAPERHYQV